VVSERQGAWSTARPWLRVAAAAAVALVPICTACGLTAQERNTDGESTAESSPLPTEPTEPTATPTPSTSPSTSPSAPPTTGPAPSREVAAELLRKVRVAEELDDAGYDRGLFPSWLDADDDGCDTRCEVLTSERLAELPGLVAGGWRSVYDGTTTDDPSQLDVDHVVALREAWRSGAATWDPPRRAAFANDLDEPSTLIAVSASSNRSKGDRDPSEWRPPDEGQWCTYVTDWLTVKLRWDLAVDPIEFTAVQFLVDTCP
jgi:hypothetical protein